MPHPDELLYGDGKFRSFEPLGDLRVVTAEGKENQHPSTREMTKPHLQSGMADKSMKYQKAKVQPRKGKKLLYDLSPSFNEGEE